MASYEVSRVSFTSGKILKTFTVDVKNIKLAASAAAYSVISHKNKTLYFEIKKVGESKKHIVFVGMDKLCAGVVDITIDHVDNMFLTNRDTIKKNFGK